MQRRDAEYDVERHTVDDYRADRIEVGVRGNFVILVASIALELSEGGIAGVLEFRLAGRIGMGGEQNVKVWAVGDVQTFEAQYTLSSGQPVNRG